MPELLKIVPRPAHVAKQGRCAGGPCVKTMLHDPVNRQYGINANQRRKRRTVSRVWFRSCSPQCGQAGASLSPNSPCGPSRCKYQIFAQTGEQPVKRRSSSIPRPACMRLSLAVVSASRSANSGMWHLHFGHWTPRVGLASPSDSISSRVYGSLSMLGSCNGRFLRHRPKRSGRCLSYGNCTKAKARCQRTKVCRRPSVKTMLWGDEVRGRLPFRYGCKRPRIKGDGRVCHRGRH